MSGVALGNFPVSNGNTTVACNFARFAAKTSKPEKLSLETKPVTPDNKTLYQTFVEPYS